MYKNILIATDGSELAAKAVAHGLSVAKALGSSVKLVTATEIWSALDMGNKMQAGAMNPVDAYEKVAAEAAANILSSAETSARQAGVPCETVHVKDQHPAEAIIETANAKGCDLIVIASHGRRGVQKVLLGSVATEVLTHCKLPVLVVR